MRPFYETYPMQEQKPARVWTGRSVTVTGLKYFSGMLTLRYQKDKYRGDTLQKLWACWIYTYWTACKLHIVPINIERAKVVCKNRSLRYTTVGSLSSPQYYPKILANTEV